MNPENKIQAVGELLPAAMADLMRAFIEKKDLEARAQIRLQMKALLDFASADTVFPKNPLTPPPKGPEIGFGGGMGVMGVNNGQAPQYGLATPLSPAVPIPAPQVIDNAELLG